MKERAREFAIAAHGEQKYGGHSYSVHLDAVAEIATEYGELAIVLAYLHDVVEDTDVTLNDIDKEFGEFVSICVALLTDEPGRNRKERKAKTYEKLAKVNGDTELALVVKTADRLANMRSCLAEQNRGLLSMYQKEHAVFKRSVFRDGLCNKFWSELDDIANG